jgi:hypothetical protein
MKLGKCGNRKTAGLFKGSAEQPQLGPRHCVQFLACLISQVTPGFEGRNSRDARMGASASEEPEVKRCPCPGPMSCRDGNSGIGGKAGWF